MADPSTPLPPLTSLRAFEAVARLGSVRGASESLGLTPSAISHQIRALETHFGVELVRRSGRGIALTEAGSAYATAVLGAFGELARASGRLLARRQDSVIRVSVTPTFATLAALPALERFRANHPRLELRIEARNTPVEFDKDSIDAAVQLGEPPFPGMISHRLFHSRGVPCADQGLLDRFGPVRTAADLARMPLIEFSTAPGIWHKWFRAAAPEVADVQPQLLSDSLLTGIEMARAGMGLILAPFPLVTPLVKSGVLTALTQWPAAGHGATSDFYFTYRPVDRASDKIQTVQRWLKAIARDLAKDAAALRV